MTNPPVAELTVEEIAEIEATQIKRRVNRWRSIKASIRAFRLRRTSTRSTLSVKPCAPARLVF